jgi:hypothetical protein
MQEAERGTFSIEQIERQAEHVQMLQTQWEAAVKKVEAYDRQITSGEEKIEAQTMKAARLSNAIEEDARAAEGAAESIEDMAENMEEATKQQDKFARGSTKAADRLENLKKRIVEVASGALVFSVIGTGFNAMRDWLGEVIVKDDEATASIARLKGALLTMAQPLLEVVIPIFRVLVDLLTAVIGKIATFLSMLSGKTVQQTAKNAKALNSQASATEALGDAAEKASGQLAGFDEINRLEDTSATSTSASSGQTVQNGEILPDFSWTEGVSENMEKIAGYVLAIAAGLALWKIGSYFTGPLGAIVTVLGKVVAGVGLVTLGITLMVEAFENASESGWNLQNTLLAVAGIVATGLGLSILTGGWIPLLVAGILSVLLAITTLTGEGGALIDGFKTMFGGFADWIGGAWSGDIERSAQGFANIWRGAFNIIASILNGLLKLIEMGLNAIQFDVPDWVPVIGGRHFGFNITAPQIPYLAQGAVIPPNREFLAVLGDQHTGTNIEAPLETIKQALAEVMAQHGGGDITIRFVGELAQLARVLKPEIDRENQRVGPSLVKGVM